MTNSSIRTEAMKWTAIVLLAAMLIGASLMAYFLPIKGYVVACKKLGVISCQLQRETSGDNRTTQVSLGTHAAATVKLQPRRRGASRVFLYLNSGSQNFFAAEFEDSSSHSQAEAAAAELNRVFSSTVPASAKIVVRPPSYFTWMIWGGIGFLCLLVLIIYRELFKPELRPDK